jgi:hypothetical protein
MTRYLATFSWIALATSASAAEKVSYNRDIRPILTKHCTACHGGVKEAGGISFIYREKALGTGKSGQQAVIPGNPAGSEMLRRIKSTDPDEVMPKPKHGPPLNASQIALIDRWIAEGAEWQNHWSFVPPIETPAPTVSNPAWPSSGLDHFVLARLDQEKLQPAAEASPAEWLRRVSFDLTGVPPTPAELAAFLAEVAADAKGARARVVDGLLASPRFGERWAAMWLDLARYSDTYGFEKDPGRNIWPYRDWVIQAFNRDLPFDQFTIEQLAGDLLPNPTADQWLATAFHRNTQNNTEGGTDDEEFRVAAVIDRTNTTWTAWQATTFGCVQCHSHPYDPITHDEYYQFAAYFNNTEDCDLDDDFPTLKIANDPAKRDEASTLTAKLAQLRHQLNDPGRPLALATTDWQPFVADAFAPSHGTLAADPDGTIRSSGTLPVGCTHKFSGLAGPFSAMRLRIIPDHDDPKKWPERGSLASNIQVNLIDAAGAVTPVKFKDLFADQLTGPYDPISVIQGGGGAGDYPKLGGLRWFVLVPEQPVAPPPGSRYEVVIKQNGSTTGNQATPLRRFALDFTNNPGWTALVANPERAAAWQTHAALKQQLNGIPATRVPVLIERPATGQRETRVFARGNRLSKENPVTPGLPAILTYNPGPPTVTRLEMARWLVGKDNPLTARVLANRLWGELFGIGIVETTEDFGTSGAAPSHPELLDYLALNLQRQHRWSIKAFLREIALSSTYRQAARITPELAARDPQNRLLARGPRNRLGAEMVRDQALSVAGLLSPKMFGPPVFPPQPAGVWNSVYSGAAWNESKGEDRLRRGIYTYSKRTSGFPGFLTFDAPSRDLCTARRLATNTPLQALITLNDPAHIEAAQGLAKRMTEHSPDLRAQLAFGVLLATQQSAAPAMLDELVALHAAATAEYDKTPDDAAKLGATPAAAALVLTANTLLNLDSALIR